MKFRAVLLATALTVLPATVLTVLPAAPAAAANILANPGFESGLSGWSCPSDAQAVSSPVHGGTRALRATPQGSDFARCQQVVTVKPGTTYELGAGAGPAGLAAGDADVRAERAVVRGVCAGAHRGGALHATRPGAGPVTPSGPETAPLTHLMTRKTGCLAASGRRAAQTGSGSGSASSSSHSS